MILNLVFSRMLFVYIYIDLYYIYVVLFIIVYMPSVEVLGSQVLEDVVPLTNSSLPPRRFSRI